MRSRSQYTARAVAIALFSALAFGVTFVFRLPVAFLTFDFKDAVITVAAFLFGPVSALVMSFISAFLEFLTVSSTGPWGLLMNFLSSAAFSAVGALIYRFRHTLSGAVLSLCGSVLSMTGVMLLFNLFVTPHYMGVPRAEVAAMIPTLLLPFNVAKGMLNAAATVFLYKPVTVALRRARLSLGISADAAGSSAFRPNRATLLMFLLGLAFVGAGVALILCITLGLF